MADIYYTILNIIWNLWSNKIQILGSLFISLSIYSYFYRAYLIIERRNKVEKIEYLIQKFKIIMGEHELEHELLELKINKIAHNVDINIRVMKAEMRAEFDVLNIRFDNYEKFTKFAEKEIKQLKEDTDFIRASKKWKWVVGLALIGLISAFSFEKIQSWISKLLPW